MIILVINLQYVLRTALYSTVYMYMYSTVHYSTSIQILYSIQIETSSNRHFIRKFTVVNNILGQINADLKFSQYIQLLKNSFESHYMA